MFDRLLFWLREKARLLFGENTTVSASVSNSMENAIILWAQMYDTGGPWCHGGKNALHSLKLAQSVASELARLTTLEMECIVSGSARADSINTMLQPFIADLRTPVEYGCALGGIRWARPLHCAVRWAASCSGPSSMQRDASRSMLCRGIASALPALTALAA